MKINRRTVLSTAAVLGAAALVAGGTIAYFTDKDDKTNSFIVGDVDITLYESQLHRMNSGRRGSFDSLESDRDYCTYTGTNIDNNTGAGPQPIENTTTLNYNSAKYCTPGMDAYNTTGISALDNGHTGTRTWGFSDETIIADASTYKASADSAGSAGYFTRVSQNIVPGQYVRKFSYVKNNEQSSDVYALIKYMVPLTYADNVELEVPSSPYNEGYFTALTKTGDDYVAFTGAPKTYTGYEEDGYRVYAAVTNVALKPGEMTFWSPVNTVRLATTATNVNDETATVTDPNYVPSSTQIDVKVEAEAIQAKTFTNAIDAVNEL